MLVGAAECAVPLHHREDQVSVYSISLFLHVVGALGLFGAIALEWAGHEHPRRMSGPSGLAILASGIYMTATRWGFQPWIVLGLAGMVVIAALGPALARRSGAVVLSLRLRTALFLGVIFLMSTRPGWAGSLAAIGVATVTGLAAAIPARNGDRRLARVVGSER
jgi:hypothetical protein